MARIESPAMMQEIWTCERCRMHHLRPWTTCSRCEPLANTVEQESFKDQAAEARPIAIDPYTGGLLAVTQDGVFIFVRDARFFMHTGTADGIDKLVRKLTDVEAENTALHAENSRLRHRLEKS